MRLTQGMFHSGELRLQLFVDDPIASIRGTPEARNWVIAVIIMTWRILGFPLSFHKGQRGPKVVWIGATLQVSCWSVIAGIKDSIVRDLAAQTQELLKHNVVSCKDVQSFAGRGNHVAALIWIMRPFLQSAWGALSCPGEGAPAGCVWTKQLLHTLRWVSAFLDGQLGPLQRCFALEAYLGRGQQVSLALDASPWGLGAILFEGGHPVQWFASEISAEDVQILDIEKGSSSSQQVVESLAALVALRHWSDRWSRSRVQLQIRGDSVAMLTLLLKMRPPTSSKALGVIGRELALDIANACYSVRTSLASQMWGRMS